MEQQKLPVPLGRVVVPQQAKRWTKNSFVGIKPEKLATVLRQAELGQLEQWADLCDFMVQSDPYLRAVYETRLLAVTSAKLVVKPGRASPGQEAIAERAAEAFRIELERFRGLESLIHWLGHAEGVGYANISHDWQRVVGPDGISVWRSSPKPTAMRDVDFDHDWTQRVRTWDPKKGQQWLRVADDPLRYIVHNPQKLATPNVSGDLRAVAWAWLFKRWALVFQQTGLEKFAIPFLYGQVPPNATDTVRTTLQAALDSFSTEQAAVLEAGTTINALEAAKNPNDAWGAAIKSYNEEMTVGLLGSTDIVSAEGGSYARAEQQVVTGVLPRFSTIGKRIAGTLERDWATPFVKFNAHLFGGAAPVPTIEFEFIADAKPEIDALAVEVGAVTIDEVRGGMGLEEWGDEHGGAEVARKPEAASPFGDAGVALPVAEGVAPIAGDAEAKDASAALNGAQVTALKDIVGAVAAGELPRASGIEMILAAFPLDRAQAEKIMGEVGRGFDSAAKEAEAPTVESPLARVASSMERARIMQAVWEKRRSASTVRLTSRTSGGSVPMTSRVPFEK